MVHDVGFLAEEAAPFLMEAARAFGQDALNPLPAAALVNSREAVGRQLLRLSLGADNDEEFRGALAALAADPDSASAAGDLANCFEAAARANAAIAVAAASVIRDYYRRSADNGDVSALIRLGDFLYWDDPEGAAAAYREAVGAGSLHGLINLAQVLQARLGDEEAALAAYQRAAESGDPDVAAAAMTGLAELHLSCGRDAAARAVYQQAIDALPATSAAMALVGLADLWAGAGETEAAEELYRQAAGSGDPGSSTYARFALAELLAGQGEADTAEDLYRELAESGDPASSARAGFALGELLASQGGVAGAKTAWQAVIDSRDAELAGAAFVKLVNLLFRHNDIGGLRTAYQDGAAKDNPEALYALEKLGQQLMRNGDLEGAHSAWQQAIDHGYEFADELRDRMSPPS
jgi:hypothetical protein